jgi:hypothetical protein
LLTIVDPYDLRDAMVSASSGTSLPSPAISSGFAFHRDPIFDRYSSFINGFPADEWISFK